ncbi:hypothetical protein FGG08_005087 [Glutinoglossum americanum]|uniref:Uncharacterized protein n=1 Tax=Glutinoglossum americanum TaxID=1670608 RepID=A0A9P8I656_9PEZI|nr:hypothetical protein FGG08_005087 [Glutinoglossum americanum]
MVQPADDQPPSPLTDDLPDKNFFIPGRMRYPTPLRPLDPCRAATAKPTGDEELQVPFEAAVAAAEAGNTAVGDALNANGTPRSQRIRGGHTSSPFFPLHSGSHGPLRACLRVRDGDDHAGQDGRVAAFGDPSCGSGPAPAAAGELVMQIPPSSVLGTMIAGLFPRIESPGAEEVLRMQRRSTAVDGSPDPALVAGPSPFSLRVSPTPTGGVHVKLYNGGGGGGIPAVFDGAQDAITWTTGTTGDHERDVEAQRGGGDGEGGEGGENPRRVGNVLRKSRGGGEEKKNKTLTAADAAAASFNTQVFVRAAFFYRRTLVFILLFVQPIFTIAICILWALLPPPSATPTAPNTFALELVLLAAVHLAHAVLVIGRAVPTFKEATLEGMSGYRALVRRRGRVRPGDGGARWGFWGDFVLELCVAALWGAMAGLKGRVMYVEGVCARASSGEKLLEVWMLGGANCGMLASAVGLMGIEVVYWGDSFLVRGLEIYLGMGLKREEEEGQGEEMG